jgi:hypothetical protein
MKDSVKVAVRMPRALTSGGTRGEPLDGRGLGAGAILPPRRALLASTARVVRASALWEDARRVLKAIATSSSCQAAHSALEVPQAGPLERRRRRSAAATALRRATAGAGRRAPPAASARRCPSAPPAAASAPRRTAAAPLEAPHLGGAERKRDAVLPRQQRSQAHVANLADPLPCQTASLIEHLLLATGAALRRRADVRPAGGCADVDAPLGRPARWMPQLRQLSPPAARRRALV